MGSAFLSQSDFGKNRHFFAKIYLKIVDKTCWNRTFFVYLKQLIVPCGMFESTFLG